MSKSEYPFPEDEFDVAGRHRVPEGVHRTPTPRWRLLLPFLIVLLVAPVLAYAGVTYLAGLGSDVVGPGASAAPTGGVVGQALVDEGEVAEEPEPGPTPAGTPEPPAVSRDVPVLTLNGTATRGLAAVAAGRLESDGFTRITVGNARSRVPTRSTVYYRDASLAESAQRVATVLGIGQVVENGSATSSISIVLRNDYA